MSHGATSCVFRIAYLLSDVHVRDDVLQMSRNNISPTPGVSEYYDEYCLGFRNKPLSNKPVLIPPCRKSEDIEPVGGRNQERARRAMMERCKKQQQQQQQQLTGSAGCSGIDGALVATRFTSSERGTHHVQPQWRDPRWSDAGRFTTSTLYNPADRDPSFRNQFYMYNTTRIDPMLTPCKPMAVPDVHKLRYMHGTYMSPDDWY